MVACFALLALSLLLCREALGMLPCSGGGWVVAAAAQGLHLDA